MLSSLLVITFLTISSFSNATSEIKEVLQKTISVLNTFETVEYEVEIQKQDNLKKSNRNVLAKCFFDFESNDLLLGAKYHVQSKYGEQVFNGCTEFTSSIQEGRILFSDNPTKRFAASAYFMQNSIYSLRKLLPQIINDPSISVSQLNDEIIDNESYYKFRFKSKVKIINYETEIVELKDASFEQILLISKESYLPYSYQTIYPKNKSFHLSTFNNIKANAIREDSIWSYERFPREYIRQTYNEFKESQEAKKLLKIGKKAPEWELPLIEGESVALTDNNGKLILLEFWFPYCKGCVEAVPDINEIRKKYLDEGLLVYGVEFQNTDIKRINSYNKKYKIEYPTLYSGKQVAIDYGVRAAPTFILLDKRGRFLYFEEGFNKEQVIKAIEKNL